MRVKICGITTVRDALIAEEEGADAIGIVVCSDSKRSVPVENIFADLSVTRLFLCILQSSDHSYVQKIFHDFVARLRE